MVQIHWYVIPLIVTFISLILLGMFGRRNGTNNNFLIYLAVICIAASITAYLVAFLIWAKNHIQVI